MNIGVFFGSRSPEHDISIITGQLIISGLKGLGYSVTAVYIDKKGQWRLDDSLSEIKTFTAGKDLSGSEKYYLDLEQSNGKLVFKKKSLAGKEITIDLVFPAFHGANGEDGTIQGMLEMFNVPFVGCGVAASAVAMDKVLTKLFYKANDIPTTAFTNFNAKDWEQGKAGVLADIEKQLKFPLFVKPPLLGSSIGITKVSNEKDLEFAIEVALHYGNTVLVEESVQNLVDITCCVIGKDEPISSLLQESVYKKDLLSYEDKYLNDGGTQTGKVSKSTVIPARVDEKIAGEIQDLSVKIFKLLGCSGMARFDFLVDEKTGKYFANEINPLPGTIYHHLWEQSGIKLPDLLTRLISYAQETYKEKNRYVTTFESDILKQAGSAKLQTKKDASQNEQVS